MSNGFGNRIELHRRSGFLPLLGFVLFYGLVFAVLASASMNLLLLTCIGWFGLWRAGKDWQSLISPLDLAFNPPGAWRLRQPGHDWQKVTLRDSFSAWPWFTLLRFAAGDGRVINLLLLDSHCDPRARRRLMVRLRWDADVGIAGDAPGR